MTERGEITQTHVKEGGFKPPILPLVIQYRLVNVVLHKDTLYSKKKKEIYMNIFKRLVLLLFPFKYVL